MKPNISVLSCVISLVSNYVVTFVNSKVFYGYYINENDFIFETSKVVSITISMLFKLVVISPNKAISLFSLSLLLYTLITCFLLLYFESSN